MWVFQHTLFLHHAFAGSVTQTKWSCWTNDLHSAGHDIKALSVVLLVIIKHYDKMILGRAPFINIALYKLNDGVPLTVLQQQLEK